MATKWDISIPYYISLVGDRTKDINQVPLVAMQGVGLRLRSSLHPPLSSLRSFLFYFIVSFSKVPQVQNKSGTLEHRC